MRPPGQRKPGRVSAAAASSAPSLPRRGGGMASQAVSLMLGAEQASVIFFNFSVNFETGAGKWKHAILRVNIDTKRFPDKTNNPSEDDSERINKKETHMARRGPTATV